MAGMSSRGLDAVLAEGRTAVLSGTHGLERAPSETGRWGPSLVLLPHGTVAEGLAALTARVVEIIGDGHWTSGGLGRAHVTVRALEPHTDSVSSERVARYVSALQRTLDRVGPIGLSFTGIGCSTSGVMACATPHDSRADDLRRLLGEQLGTDGWLEDAVFANGRDPIWYCSLVHFAEPVSVPRDLVEWLDANRDLEVGSHRFDSVSLCMWTFDDQGMAPRVLDSVTANSAL
jgi:hypothetical protein